MVCYNKNKCQFYHTEECNGIKRNCLAKKPCYDCNKRDSMFDEDCKNYGNCKAFKSWMKEGA